MVSVRRYGVAVVLVGIAIITRGLLHPVLEASSPFLLFTVAVAVAAKYGGLGPGLFATALSAVAAIYLFIPPEFSLAVADPREGVRITIFVIAGVLISTMTDALHRARREALQSAHDAAQHARERHHSEILRRQMIDDVQDFAIMQLDADGQIIGWNRGAEHIFGYTESEVLHEPVALLFTPEDRAQRAPQQRIKLAVETGRAGEDRWAVRKDGSRFFMSGTITATRDVNGTLLGFTKIVRDLTERQQAEQRLQEQEQQFRTLANSIPHLAWMADANGRISWYNQRWFEYTGASAREMEGSGWEKVHHPDEVARVTARFTEAISTGTPWEDVFPLRRRDGQYRRFLSRALPIHDVRGRIVRWFGTNTDVEEQLRAEESLRGSEERLRLAGAAAGIGFWTWYPQSDAVDLDATARAMFGLDLAAPLTANDLLRTIHADDREAMRIGITAAVTVLTPYSLEFRVLHENGSTRWLLGRGNAVREGTAVRLTGIIMDVTDRKQAEADREHLMAQRNDLLDAERAARREAERVNREKDEFLSTVSHELRTPINAVLGWAQILQRTEALNEQIRRPLTIIERNAVLQAQLIDDLLDITRGAQGKLRIHADRVDFRDVVWAAVESIRPQAKAKDIQLYEFMNCGDAPVLGEAKRLQQVCWNLLSNAIKFTPPGGAIRIELTGSDDRVDLVVVDTGEGIAPQFLPFVFDRFRQADASTTRKHGGLGLGLSIVKQFVELHGGRVWAESEGVGHGATFGIELPLKKVPEEDRLMHRVPVLADEPEVAFDCDSIEGTKALVVDDDPEALEVVKRFLAECGADVVTASSAASGLERLTRELPDVLISDISMPSEDGYEFIRRVRQLPANSGGTIPAIALTAFARGEDRRRTLAAGYQYHLSKPVYADELITAVAQLVRGHKGAPSTPRSGTL
jgi:PAS domain S-box-containing protein